MIYNAVQKLIDYAIKKYETARYAMRGVAEKSKYARSYKNPYES